MKVSCQNCGARVDLPAGFAKARIRCTGCGYYADVPDDVRAANAAVPPTTEVEPSESDELKRSPTRRLPPTKTKSIPAASGGLPVAAPVKAKPQLDPRDFRPIFEADEAVGPPLLHGTQDEDDERPYSVPGPGLKRCPECRGNLPISAELCVHCGLDLITGEKPDRQYQLLFKVWESFAPFDKRLLAFVVLQVVSVAFFLITVVWQGVGALPGIMFIAFQVALQAFLVGSYETITVRRDAKGRTQITKVWRICFIPTKPAKVPWKTSEGIGIIATHNPGVFEWGTFLYLLMLGCLPGILFYLFVIRPERYEVALCDVHGSTDLVIFHTGKRDVADDVCRTVSNATGLWYKPVL
ncbi:MAG TPA: hypothetical protein VGJ05_03135 [Fimbriiglobus sp.]|jgi:hypothetical protein